MHKWISVLILFFTEIETLQHAENYYKGRGARVRHETRSNSSRDNGQSFCNIEHLEYRLRDFETQIIEKSEKFQTEIRENNNRLERQNVNILIALENYRKEIRQQTSSELPTKIEYEIENLQKGMQIMTAAMRGLRTKIQNLEKNLSVSLDPNQNNSPQKASPVRSLPRNCQDLFGRGTNISGVYLIQPQPFSRSFPALCDMETSGGGWTYIQNRFTGTQDFYLDWKRYKVGFGNLGGEFWIGLENLHHLTGFEVNELLIELVDLEENRVYAHYLAFSVGSEEEGYSLKLLGGYGGSAGDSLSYHAGSRFSTKDQDQDEWEEGSCAQAHSGAWWYKSCDKSNLNGKYLKGDVPEAYAHRGMYWNDFRGAHYSLLRTRLMIRPRIDPHSSFSPGSEVGSN